MFKSNTRILVVDDMKTMRLFVKKALKQLGFENFEEADDGETAYPKIEEAINSGSPFQLVLSDWNMPNMSGLDLLKKVKENPAMAGLPFILVTAESEASQVKVAIEAGVSNYIVKPFSADKLKGVLEQVYARHFQKKAS